MGPWSLKYYLVPKAQKVLVFRVLSTLKKHNINIILGTWQIDWNKVRKRRDNSN